MVRCDASIDGRVAGNVGIKTSSQGGLDSSPAFGVNVQLFDFARAAGLDVATGSQLANQLDSQ